MDRFKIFCKDKGYYFSSYQESSTMEDVCRNADIIITANSQADSFDEYPCIMGNYLKKNAIIIVVSALRIENDFVNNEEKCVCVADFLKAYEKNRGIDAVSQISDGTLTFKDALSERLRQGKSVLELPYIADDSAFIRDEKKVYVCASGGIPTEDVAWAMECYKTAKENGIGTELTLWDESSL